MRFAKYITQRLAPAAFAVGMVLGFLYCRYWGGVYSRQNPYHNFVRFYQALGPPSNYFPSVSQLVALCNSRAGADDILVVIGGNSTLLGVDQPVEELWSTHLQEHLGAGFAVVNLAQRGGYAMGAAESVAEALLKQGRKIIYVANPLTTDWDGPDGAAIYEYMYWNARARNLLYSWEPRERYFASDGVKSRSDLVLRSRLDVASNAEDLWNTLCYEHFCTAWDSYTRGDFWRPRKWFKDEEGPRLPVPQRFASDLGRMVQRLHDLVKVPGGEAMDQKVWDELKMQIEAGFVPQLRPRTLIVVTSIAPYDVHQLKPEEQERYLALRQRIAMTYEAGGIRAMEAGSLYADEDYGDSVHMVASGGRRLAREVAPEVRRIAHDVYGK